MLIIIGPCQLLPQILPGLAGYIGRDKVLGQSLQLSPAVQQRFKCNEFMKAIILIFCLICFPCRFWQFTTPVTEAHYNMSSIQHITQWL